METDGTLQTENPALNESTHTLCSLTRITLHAVTCSPVGPTHPAIVYSAALRVVLSPTSSLCIRLALIVVLSPVSDSALTHLRRARRSRNEIRGNVGHGKRVPAPADWRGETVRGGSVGGLQGCSMTANHLPPSNTPQLPRRASRNGEAGTAVADGVHGSGTAGEECHPRAVSQSVRARRSPFIHMRVTSTFGTVQLHGTCEKGVHSSAGPRPGQRAWECLRYLMEFSETVAGLAYSLWSLLVTSWWLGWLAWLVRL